MNDTPIRTIDPRLDALLLRHEIETFNGAYAAALDEQRLTDWAEMFTEDALLPRPLAGERRSRAAGRPDLLRRQGMIHDRAFAMKETPMFAPRYLRHFIGNLIRRERRRRLIRARANYLVMQVLLDGPTPSCTRSASIMTRSAGSTAA